MDKKLSFLDVITVISFILQLDNNEELQKQSTNDDIQNNLHNDIMELLEDNKKRFDIVIKQNEEILKLLRKED